VEVLRHLQMNMQVLGRTTMSSCMAALYTLCRKTVQAMATGHAWRLHGLRSCSAALRQFGAVWLVVVY
jgi:hypothetical protein